LSDDARTPLRPTPDPERPVRTALLATIAECIAEAARLDPASVRTEAEAFAALGRVYGLIVEAKELLDWTGPPFDVPPEGQPPLAALSEAQREQRAWSGFQIMRQSGKSEREAWEFSHAMMKPGRGRPATKRYLAVRALDLKLTTRLTWKEVTQNVCQCGLSEHTANCQKHLDRQVLLLKKVLKKYSISAPSK
jgi:hypothetical protein